MYEPVPSVEGAPAGRFYGWAIVAAMFGVHLMAFGPVALAFSVLLVPITETLGVGRAEATLAMSIHMIVAALVSPWVGKLVTTRSIRGVMLVGVVPIVAGFLAAASGGGLVALYLGFGLMLPIGFTMMGPIVLTALIANWFVRKRGTALGLAMLGGTASGVITIPLATWLVATFGWRPTLVVFAVVLALVLVPLIWLVVRDRPEDLGQRPDGAAPEPPVDNAAEPPGPEWTVMRCLRTPKIVLLAVVAGCVVVSPAGISQVLFSHVEDLGLSRTVAATTLVLMNLFSAVGLPLFGSLADYFPPRALLAGVLVLGATGLYLIAGATTPAGFAVASAFFGLAMGGLIPVWSVMIGALVGTAALGRVMGSMMLIMTPFYAIGPPVCGYVFDTTGSYVPAFLGFLGFFVVAAIALAFVPIPDRNHWGTSG